MKTSVVFLLLIALSFSGGYPQSATTPSTPTTFMSYNIRFNNPNDGENAWPKRSDNLIAMLRNCNPQVLCMQEVLAGQLKDILTALPQYSAFGAGRDDGKEAGEFVPVLFDKNRFSLLKSENFWLSETPEKPGKPGWDGACSRMVSWVNLVDRSTGDTLYVFNTHFDHVGVIARVEGAKLLARMVDSIATHYPTIVTGDFNATIRDTPNAIMIGAGFKDSRLISKSSAKGPEYTFTGFDASKKPGDRIDFIYLKNTKPVKSYVVRDDSVNGFYLSDHLPVIITLE
jgi:endonuclease/exonuclease/phosphatase family metal-dependent hydrolase